MHNKEALSSLLLMPDEEIQSCIRIAKLSIVLDNMLSWTQDETIKFFDEHLGPNWGNSDSPECDFDFSTPY